MINDPQQLLYDFRMDLQRFGDEVAHGAVRVFRAAAQTAIEAITIGNAYGPGIPVDTGWARASFRVGLNAPVAGDTAPPIKLPGQGKGLGAFGGGAGPSMGAVGRAQLGDTVYASTMAEYPQYLEFHHLRRRFGKNAGMDTAFLAPVEARWAQIVDDMAVQAGYGR